MSDQGPLEPNPRPQKTPDDPPPAASPAPHYQPPPYVHPMGGQGYVPPSDMDTPRGTPKPPHPSWYEPPIDPAAGSKHEMPAYQPAPESHASPLLLKILWSISGAVFLILFGVSAWFLGNIQARLDRAELKVQELDKNDVSHDAQIKSILEQDRKQWELIGENGRAISGMKGKFGDGG